MHSQTVPSAHIVARSLARTQTPALFEDSFRAEWLAAPLAEALAATAEGGAAAALTALCTEVSAGVFAFPMFTPEFCAL